MFFEKCVQCGCFVGFKNYVVSAPYGSYGDLEPPDDEYECLRCWDEQDEEWRALTYKVSYIKPVVVRNGVETRYVPSSPCKPLTTQEVVGIIER
jgi:hypothetical protein